jgi:hypothetical protein
VPDAGSSAGLHEAISRARQSRKLEIGATLIASACESLL